LKLLFGYDYMSRRISKTVSNWNGSAWTLLSDQFFAYDGWNLLATLHYGLSLQTFFVWGADLSGSMQGAGGVGGLLGISSGTTNCFVTYGGNGNVMSLVNSADGAVVASYVYGPFGEVTKSAGPMVKNNPFRFSTKFQDDESDLLYYGFRYYCPGTGRWLSRDPLEELGGNNIYEFTHNDSLNFYDALGLKKCGVESFSVQWLPGSITYANGTKNLINLVTRIKFKSGDDYDPRCCEFKQNAFHKWRRWKKFGPVTDADDNSPLHDDGYSRKDNDNGNTDPSNTEFAVGDAPGIKDMENGWVIDYQFTAEQIVYSPGKSFSGDPKQGTQPCDCEKNDRVASKGPHTATLYGAYPGPYQTTGLPADL
jgi:RHS repeat-associated protein